MQTKVIRQPNLCIHLLGQEGTGLVQLLALFEGWLFWQLLNVFLLKVYGSCCQKVILKPQQDIFVINMKVRQVFLYYDRLERPTLLNL